MKHIIAKLCRLRVFRGLSEQELSWVLYDVGNSAFTMLACSLIPIWFKEVAIGPGPPMRLPLTIPWPSRW